MPRVFLCKPRIRNPVLIGHLIHTGILVLVLSLFRLHLRAKAVVLSEGVYLRKHYRSIGFLSFRPSMLGGEQVAGADWVSVDGERAFLYVSDAFVYLKFEFS